MNNEEYIWCCMFINSFLRQNGIIKSYTKGKNNIAWPRRKKMI